MKRAQAAMEFLMTYGWAILVVLVAIGALAYFGVLNPESCTIEPGIGCEDFIVRADGSAQLNVRNGIGDDLTSVTVQIGSAAATGTGVNDCSAVSWGNGDMKACTWTGLATVTGTVGAKFKADVVFSYTSSSGIAHTKTGVLTTKEE
jgi:uncharacterized protein (UPF0333 family)|tara:strand:- start:26 stop:466 length:441 start_codon:yes stop_codon:yes gene_type:complete